MKYSEWETECIKGAFPSFIEERNEMKMKIAGCMSVTEAEAVVFLQEYGCLPINLSQLGLLSGIEIEICMEFRNERREFIKMDDSSSYNREEEDIMSKRKATRKPLFL